MLGTRLVLPKRGRDEGEKPFWISYADLMTALMMLFLVVMAVSLFAITSRETGHEQEINACMAEFQTMVATHNDHGVSVDKEKRQVSFGERARFANKDYNLSTESAQRLREFAPVVLRFANTSCGKKLLKRVVVEGYTSRTGTYLFNLDLSLKRAHSVLCALFDKPITGEKSLSENARQQIRRLFLVGGYSFNSSMESDEVSRRVELKLEFWKLDEKDKAPKQTEINDAPIGPCMLERHVVTN